MTMTKNHAPSQTHCPTCGLPWLDPDARLSSEAAIERRLDAELRAIAEMRARRAARN